MDNRSCRIVAALCVGLSTMLGVACSDGDEQSPTGIETLAVDETVEMGCLGAPVDVVYDTRGIPHVYAQTLEDGLCAQGFVQARDRFPQLELFRRTADGTLAAVLGNVEPTLVQDDEAQRVLGFARQARATYEAAPEGSPTRVMSEALAAGINVYVERLLAGDESVPPGSELVNLITTSPAFGPWVPEDVLAISQLQASSIYGGGPGDISRTRGLELTLAEFPASSADPDRAARAGIYSDIMAFAPAHEAPMLDGFPNLGTDTGSRALIPPSISEPVARPRPSLERLDAALGFFDRVGRLTRFKDPDQGASNNWVVSGDHTASGAPLLANDPHLELVSPSFWYLLHINTARAGGDIDVFGAGVPGTPVPLVGHNRHVAWGVTNTQYDVSDVYEEQITPGVGGAPDTVLRDGAQVPIETVDEVIHVAGGGDVTFPVEMVPGHGPILPDTRTADSGMSVKWTGGEGARVAETLLGMWRAASVDEVRTALDDNGLLSINFVIASGAGDIFWTTQSRLPVRPPQACNYAIDADGVPSGNVPMLVLPGTGEADWTGYLEDRYLPHQLNPDRGFITTANQDPVGATFDGDPCNDAWYLGGTKYAYGWRAARLVERLTELVSTGGITGDDMVALQADTRSNVGADLRDGLVGSLDAALEENAMPGSHSDLTAAVTAAGTGGMARIADFRDRLAAWTLQTPAGIEAADPQVVADSVATTLFNVGVSHLLRLTFEDELTVIDYHPSLQRLVRFLIWAYEDPTQLYTYDTTFGDTVVWDDLNTPSVEESRDERVLQAFLATAAELETDLGADADQWRWGKLHTVRFSSLIPAPSGDNGALAIPPSDDPELPDGFSRHGDLFNVDSANPHAYGGDMSYTDGPSLRFVAEMHPDGPHARGALPGGESIDPRSPHHADEAEYWRNNEAPDFWFEEDDVVAHAERRMRLVPPGG